MPFSRCVKYCFCCCRIFTTCNHMEILQLTGTHQHYVLSTISRLMFAIRVFLCVCSSANNSRMQSLSLTFRARVLDLIVKYTNTLSQFLSLRILILLYTIYVRAHAYNITSKHHTNQRHAMHLRNAYLHVNMCGAHVANITRLHRSNESCPIWCCCCSAIKWSTLCGSTGSRKCPRRMCKHRTYETWCLAVMIVQQLLTWWWEA